MTALEDERLTMADFLRRQASDARTRAGNARRNHVLDLEELYAAEARRFARGAELLSADLSGARNGERNHVAIVGFVADQVAQTA